MHLIKRTMKDLPRPFNYFKFMVYYNTIPIFHHISIFQMEKLRQKKETLIQNIQWLSPETELLFPNSKFARVFWSCLRRPSSRHDQNSDTQLTAFVNKTMTTGTPSNWHEWNQKPIEPNNLGRGYMTILTVKLWNANMQPFSRKN